ncbi:MAG: C-N hydrolase family amidase [Methanoregula sp. PtaU1.Bin051]|nr:MAG: C-N hydrolase family amidase [Methanoregula sp. PtaU1.Bin051]
MKCCCAQITACWEDPKATLDKIRPQVAKAAGDGASLIAFPEQFATGWDPASNQHVQDLSGPIVTALKAYAEEYAIAILGSYREAHRPLPFNTAIAIGPDGSVIAQYRKMHPFTFAGENVHYAPGDDLGIFDVRGFRLGIAICYDLRFPELFRLYADKGVHGVVVPSAWPESRLSHWELFIRSRAAENQMYVIGVNATGTTPVDTYAGTSMVAGPDGFVSARAGSEETFLTTELDAGIVKEVRRQFPALKDQRAGIYRKLGR